MHFFSRALALDNSVSIELDNFILPIYIYINIVIYKMLIIWYMYLYFTLALYLFMRMC